jgi:hypothetical protein
VPKAVGSGRHGEQHYTCDQPLRSGTVLSATTRDGETWQKQGRRGGKLVFSETITDYFDQNGDLITMLDSTVKVCDRHSLKSSMT